MKVYFVTILVLFWLSCSGGNNSETDSNLNPSDSVQNDSINQDTDALLKDLIDFLDVTEASGNAEIEVSSEVVPDQHDEQNEDEISYPETAIDYSPIVLSLTSTGFKIQWGTADNFPSSVIFSKKGDAEVKEIAATSEKYEVVSDYPIPEIESFKHTVFVTDLVPSTVYEYKVRTGSTESKIYKIKTHAESSEKYSFVVFGDTRTDVEAHAKVVSKIVSFEPEVVLNTGDLIAVGISIDQWKKFFQIEENLLATTKTLFAIGNHEGILGEPLFLSLLGLNKTYYFYQLYDSCFYLLDSNKDFEESGQLKWLKDNLEKADTNGCVFNFVAFHTPIYTFSNHSPDKELRKEIMPVLKEYKVDALFQGHNHLYEHFLVDGVHIIVSGGGGAPLYSPKDHVIPEDEQYYVTGAKIHHFVMVEIENKKATFKVFDVDSDTIFEQFEISK